MGCVCSLLGRDDSGQDKTWQQEGANDVCPKCGKELKLGDRILMDDENVVYHYDCLEGPKPPYTEGVISQD